jgi:hypothetical protein
MKYEGQSSSPNSSFDGNISIILNHRRTSIASTPSSFVAQDNSLQDVQPTPIGGGTINVLDHLSLNEFHFNNTSTIRDLRDWTRLLRETRNNVPSDLPSARMEQTIGNDPRAMTIQSVAPKRGKEEEIKCVHESSSDWSDEGGSKTKTVQIHDHQNEKWNERYQQLVDFHRIHGHTVVPYHYKESPPLAWWVKRQRHQWRMKISGDHTTLTDERQQKLEELNFIWDTRAATWEQRFYELAQHRMTYGHTNVSRKKHSKLLMWIKCQRRQYKLFCAGEKSSLNMDRIRRMNDIGFKWAPTMKTLSP